MEAHLLHLHHFLCHCTFTEADELALVGHTLLGHLERFRGLDLHEPTERTLVVRVDRKWLRRLLGKLGAEQGSSCTRLGHML